PDFVRLAPEARGAFFTALLYLWDAGSLPEGDLEALTGCGEGWPRVRAALLPLFERRGGRWSIPWQQRYRSRAQKLSQSGRIGAAVTNEQRRALHGSADSMVPSRSGSGSGSGSDSKKTAAAAAGWLALIDQLQREHPERDVPSIAA